MTLRSPHGLAFLVFALLLVGPLAARAAAPLEISEYRPSDATWCSIRAEWLSQIYANNPPGTWVPMKFTPTDDQLRRLGLPSRAFLLSHRFAQPTLVMPDGTQETVALPDVSTAGTASFAGAGCFGIRPGAWLLTVTDAEIGWCSMAHVYGAPGSYEISTAGHCGKTGDIATVIAGTGNRGDTTGVILLDFGKYVKSTGDAGIGKDWALIGVDAAWQHLVSPTMCEWGGPIGMYTKTGALVAPTWARGTPTGVTTDPDPTLASEIVHYGHGTGAGAGGTGRAAQVLEWRASDYSFVGTITPGDSGSGSNTVLGDSIGTEREAAGINTHLYVGTSYYQSDGLGIMAGTRATLVQATLANGQLVPYPAPVPSAP